MKRFIYTAWLGLGFSSVALAAPNAIYQNFGPVTVVPTIDAVVFYNASLFELNTISSLTNFNNNVGTGFSSIPYSTSDTLYFTNTASGVMSATPGFQFDTVTSKTRHSASSFVNHGSIIGFDNPAFPDIYSTTTGTVAIVADSQPVASHVEILATNIVSDGSISVGNYGLLKMQGNTINNENGVLVAGALNTGDGLNVDPIDTTGDNNLFYIGFNYYVSPPGVYDLFWGVTNGGPLALDQFSPPNTGTGGGGVKVGARNGITAVGLGLPLNFGSGFASYVSAYQTDVSNTYFNIVFVNTNFTDINGQTDTNITASVGYSYDYTILSSQVGDLHAEMAMVQFAMAIPDVITGQVVTNAVYLLDAGGAYAPMVDYDNAGSANGYNRPNAFVITTTTPGAWLFNTPSNFVYTNALIYAPGTYSAKSVTFEAGEYGAQIGRNPSQVSGGFNFQNTVNFFGTNIISVSTGLGGLVALPDPANEAARIELTANQLDLSNSRIRSEGMVILNATNFIGNTAGSDWGEINTQIGATNGSLVISKLFPTNFQRLRGDIYAWSGTWQNTTTNNIITESPLNLPAGSTNTFHYHLLVVDQNLGGNFQSAVRNLSLTGSNSINVQDALYVINQSFFNTSNLTFSSNSVFTQNAGNLTPTNMPKLKNLLNNTNAELVVDGLLNVGFNVTKPQAPPAGRKYTVTSVTNLGMMFATTPLFQSSIFENDGLILADNNGSIVIEAASLGFGLALTNGANYLVADQNITLSAITNEIVDSYIITGGLGGQGHGLLLLETTPGGQITDFVPGLPSTNSYATNIWQVTGGFSLPVKPATGDLFGTEITTIATNFSVALHTWAGADLGATSAGFGDNVVIGHLKLSRQSETAELHFTGAGAQNGMYVDYLELDPNSLSFTNYRNGLVIDSNLTIYFAASNVDPTKLTNVFPNRLVWVPEFSGPNSSVSIPYTNCAGVTNYCLMNANVADSSSISFFPPVPNADNQPFILNDPTGNCSNVFQCPDSTTMFKDFLVRSSVSNDISVKISTVGDGTITPNLKQKQMVLGKEYTLTATPSNGWVFAGWSVSGLTGKVNTSSRVLKFKLENSVVLTANFTAKIFTLVRGDYYGLFLDPSNQLGSANSGWFTFTLHDSGAFSGKVLMGPASYNFSSKFSEIGSAQVAAKQGSQFVTVNLQLDMTGKTGQVTGYVNDPSVRLLGNLTPGWTAQNPSPYAGRYTMILTNNGTTNPIGDTYGSVVISPQGNLTISGKLADGKAFSQAVPIAPDGLWPFYAYVPSGEDFLLGWVAFRYSHTGGASLGETNLFWSKGPSAKGYYPAGFADTFGFLGSPYFNPGRNASGLRLTDPVIVLSGGGRALTETNPVAYNGRLTYATNDLTLSINPTVGSFTGRLKNGEEGASIKLEGVVLQNQDGAFGFFLGTNDESGAVLLQSR